MLVELFVVHVLEAQGPSVTTVYNMRHVDGNHAILGKLGNGLNEKPGSGGVVNTVALFGRFDLWAFKAYLSSGSLLCIGLGSLVI